MGDLLRVDLYCEDDGHEQFARALVGRLARQVGLGIGVETVSGRGGHGRAIREFRAWQRTATADSGLQSAVPDLLVILIDANCTGWAEARRDLEQSIRRELFPRWAVGCPDPHVERWCLADPTSFKDTLGAGPPADPGKCERKLYKRLLREAILNAGQPILTNEMEYAQDLVEAMDLYRAGKNQPSLRHFVESVSAALQSLLGDARRASS